MNPFVHSPDRLTVIVFIYSVEILVYVETDFFTGESDYVYLLAILPDWAPFGVKPLYKWSAQSIFGKFPVAAALSASPSAGVRLALALRAFARRPCSIR